MSRIGILTHYYNSTNYGGSLQAYALCKVLSQIGHDAEQIRIDHTLDCQNLLDTSALAPLKRLVGKPVKRAAKKAITCVVPRLRRQQQAKEVQRTTLLKAFAPFHNATPHSETVYTAATIRNTCKDYDAFIVGSDQVWNPCWYFPPFFLSFVPSGTPKLAYAASIAQTSLPENVQKVFQNHLKDFSGISVREGDAVRLLQAIVPGAVDCVLDPTLLLSLSDWAQIAAPRQVAEPYVFCYFLGDDPAIRQTATEYAKHKGVTLVTIPHAGGLIHENDSHFGDVQIETPSPEMFLSLIQNAQYVFTDSFHASVFSLIFQRQFVVFSRTSHRSMSSRLTHLTALFDIPERFCDAPEKFSFSHIINLPAIDYSAECQNFQTAKQKSLSFLMNNLESPKENAL